MFAFVILFVLLGPAVRANAIDAERPGTASDLQGKLVFAHVLYRHGDRTPVDPYPTDPWRDPKYWPTGWGQLTNIGKRQHYELGKWLRRRYNSLLNETYSNQEVYIQSTDVDRTLMSALSNLAGMFPPKGKDIWNEGLAWQPIPIHTIPENEDSVLANKKPCPAYKYALSKLLHTEFFQKLDKRFASLYEYLTKMTGRKINTLETAEKIYDTFVIEEKYNLTLPEWSKKVYPSDDLYYIAVLSFAVDTYTRPLARLKTGPLLKDILQRFQDKANNNLNPNRSLWIYSAHDTTVANLLNTLGVFELHSPPYTACIMLEMRLIESTPFISVFYKNTTAEPFLMSIPACGKQCPLERMYELYSDVLPGDWDAECGMSMFSMTYEDASVTPAMTIVVSGSLFVFTIVLIYIGIVYYRRRQYFDYRWYMHIDS